MTENTIVSINAKHVAIFWISLMWLYIIQLIVFSIMTGGLWLLINFAAILAIGVSYLFGCILIGLSLSIYAHYTNTQFKWARKFPVLNVFYEDRYYY